jgi:hypothetical protein
MTSVLYLPLINPYTAAVSAKFSSGLFKFLDAKDECVGYDAEPEAQSVLVTIQWADGVDGRTAEQIVQQAMCLFEKETGMVIDGRVARSGLSAGDNLDMSDPSLETFRTQAGTAFFRKNSN